MKTLLIILFAAFIAWLIGKLMDDNHDNNDPYGFQ